ncbi:MAG TPA: polyprenyl synthetase family protein [Candidatus Saccharimonadales bacterium]|nr:polyprenyl synthetase family protein [Candidatus Saccharimonadales bacterium]
MKSFDIATILSLPELPQYLEQVEAQLQKVLTPDDPMMRTALQRMLRSGGKRLRAALVMAAGGQRKSGSQLVAAGAAVELLHLGSLIHDDIIDDALVRRGAPAVNAKEGTACAILSGDYALALACKEATEVSAAAGSLMAATIMTLCEGEAKELADVHRPDRSLASLDVAMHGKTAALMATACQLGGMVGGYDKPIIVALGTFGQHFGMAFQHADDLLDFISTAALLGKPVGNDVQEGVYTLPVIVALQGKYGNEVRQLLARKSLADSLPELRALLQRAGAFEQSLQVIRSHVAEAHNALSALTDARHLALADLPNAYIEWAMNNLVAPEYRATLQL